MSKAKKDKRSFIRALFEGTATVRDLIKPVVTGMRFADPGEVVSTEDRPSWFDQIGEMVIYSSDQSLVFAPDPGCAHLIEQQEYIKANPSIHATPPLTRKEKRRLAKQEKEQASLAPVLPLQHDQPRPRPFAQITEYGFSICPTEYDDVRRQLNLNINNIMR